MSELTHDTFAGREGETFEVDVPGAAPRTVTLRTVSRQQAADRRAESFTLEFRGDGDMLPQGTYLFRHAQVGDQPIFVVPVGREPDGFVYEAVFTHLAED